MSALLLLSMPICFVWPRLKNEQSAGGPNRALPSRYVHLFLRLLLGSVRLLRRILESHLLHKCMANCNQVTPESLFDL